jgi:hypothetical protein
MVYEAACAFLHVAPTWNVVLEAPPPLQIITSGLSATAAALEAVSAGYDIDADDAALRRIVAEADPANAWRTYREQYPPRRELGGRSALTFSPACGPAARAVAGLVAGVW